MATAGDGVTTYQSGGVGGKFRKRPIRRSSQATPYDRPPTALRNNSSSLLAKLVDPASRLIYAGADRLFGVFRKRLPSIPAESLPGTSEEPRNGFQEAGPNSASNDGNGVLELRTNEGGNLASVSAATGISDLEIMLKQKTFSRSEIERLTALLHSRTIESDVGEGDRAKLPSKTSDLLRLEASTSGTLNTHLEARETSHLAISTPVVNSRIFEEDVASPAELAKAYMGTRSAKQSPLTLNSGRQPTKQDSVLFNDSLLKTPVTSHAPKTTGTFKVSENGLTTPRSRGRSAIYSMARTPYYRGPATFSQKVVPSPSLYSLIPSQPTAWEHEGSIGSSKMAAKRRSSVLEDIGSGGPIRRIRQKANLLSQGTSLSRQRSEFASSQKLLSRNEPEPKSYKAVEENGETSKRDLGFASVPTESSQMALKIFEQLERMSPMEKPSGSRVAVTTEKVDSPKFAQDNKKSEGQHRVWLPDARDSTSQSKDTFQENGPRIFAGPNNVLGLMNGNSTVPVRGEASVVTNTGSTSKVAPEPSQKKRTFLMSAHEDSLELDDNDRSNGHVSMTLDENIKLNASGYENNDISTDAPTEIVQTPAVPEDRKTSLPELNKFPGISELKKNATSPPKTCFGPPGGSTINCQMGSNSTASSPSSSNNQSPVLSQSTSIADTVAPQREPTVSPKFGTSTTSVQKVPSFSFSANEPSGIKPNNSPDARPHGLTSLMNADMGNNQLQFPASRKDDNGNASASGIFSFGGSTRNSSVTSGTAASTSFFASSASSQASGTNTNKLFSNSSSHVLPSATTALSSTTTTTTSAVSSSLSVPAPIFSFGSSTAASVAPTSVAEAPMSSATKGNEQKSDDINSSPFVRASFATTSNGGSVFGFSSPAATSTNNQYSQGSLFNSTNGFQANTHSSSAVTQAVPFNFGSSSTALVSGIPSSSSGSFHFSSSAPSFGLSSAVNASEIKSGSSTSTTTNLFDSGFNTKPTFGFGSTVAPTEAKSGSSTSGSTTSIFGSTPFSFGASSTSMPSATSSPVMFGSPNTGAPTGSSMFSFTSASVTNSSFLAPVFGASPTNNDQMSIEDSMADDFTQTPSPSVPAFAQAFGGTIPGFMFGSGTQTPPTIPFQFGGQTSQPPSQNPFQASGSVEFNAGGSFSLGSGGGDKSGRRILKVKRQIKRK